MGVRRWVLPHHSGIVHTYDGNVRVLSMKEVKSGLSVTLCMLILE